MALSAGLRQEFVVPADKTNGYGTKNVRGRAPLMRRNEIRSNETTAECHFSSLIYVSDFGT